MNLDTNTVLMILAAVIGVLFLWTIFLTYRQQKMYKRVGKVFDTSKNGDIYKILEKYLKETKEVENYAKKVEIEMAKISKKMQKSIQKIGFVRYNPFGKNDTGGNQSFSIALLDKDDSGFVITSMHAREGTRVYAKPVSEGKSTNTLSDEEIEAVKKAAKE
ncbi:MAG: DUF4446 family protein [Patescibacteria group bacterium]